MVVEWDLVVDSGLQWDSVVVSWYLMDFNGGFMGFSGAFMGINGCLMGLIMMYPLVNMA